MDDSKIIELFINRSEDALKELMKKYNAYMHCISKNIVSVDEDVEECLDDAYMKIWKSIPPVIPKSLRAYLGTIIRNTSLDKYRKSHTQKRNKGEFTLVLDELYEIIPDDFNVEKILVNKELINEINLFLKKTSKEKRIIFVMRYYQSYSIQEISSSLNMSESKVKMILMRLRQMMRLEFEERGLYNEK